MLLRLVQFENALSPITVTLSGIIIFFRFSQPENAWKPIYVIPSRIDITFVRFSQSSNAL